MDLLPIWGDRDVADGNEESMLKNRNIGFSGGFLGEHTRKKARKHLSSQHCSFFIAETLNSIFC